MTFTQGPDQVVIRTPRPVRIFGAVFMVAWYALVISFLVRGVHRGGADAIIPIFMLAVGMLVVTQIIRCSVRTTGDHLNVCNGFTTRRIPRSDVQGFRMGSTSWTGAGRVVFAVLRDGTVVPMRATQGARFLPPRWSAEGRLEELQRWLTH